MNPDEVEGGGGDAEEGDQATGLQVIIFSGGPGPRWGLFLFLFVQADVTKASVAMGYG